MVKRFLIIFFITCFVYGSDTNGKSIYQKKCLVCHQNVSINMQKMFFSYLIKYSSEFSVKSAMIDFLKNPNRQTSALDPEDLRIYGLKTKSAMSDKELKKVVDYIWNKYKVFGKLW